jgi:putative MFS transporter
MDENPKYVRDVEMKISNDKKENKSNKFYEFHLQVDGTDTSSPEADESRKTEENQNESKIKTQVIELSEIDAIDYKEESSVDKLIDEIGITWYNMRIYIILSLFFLADGAEMIVISLLVSKLGAEWGLSHTEKAFMGSAVFVGFFIGALISGKLSDTRGRKPTFIIGALLVCIFATGSAFSPNYLSFLILRALNGLGIGMSIPSSTSLATEITPTVYRAWVLNLVWIFFPFGEIFAVLIAKNVLETNQGWRYLLGYVAIPTILAFILSFFIFESPKYYLAIKEYDKAFNGLNRMMSYVNKSKISEQLKNKIIRETECSSKSKINPNFTTLLKKEYLSLTLKTCFIFYISSFIYYGLIFILPQAMENIALNQTKYNSTLDSSLNYSNFDKNNAVIVNLTENDRNEMYKGIIFSSLSEIPSTLLTGYLANVKFLGRIKSMGFGFLLTALSAIICGTFLDYLSISASLLKFAIDIPFGIIYIYVSEAFPTKIRSIGIGVTNAFNRLGGITTPLFSQFAFSYSNAMPFFLYAFVGAAGMILSFLLPFETLGRPIH